MQYRKEITLILPNPQKISVNSVRSVAKSPFCSSVLYSMIRFRTCPRLSCVWWKFFWIGIKSVSKKNSWWKKGEKRREKTAD